MPISDPSEADAPYLQQYRVILQEILRPGLDSRSYLPLYRFLQLLHSPECFCEPLCLENPTCDCPADSHLDVECHKLRQVLCEDLEAFLRKIGVNDGS